jgi:NAD(P)-dependent dehydrogenase (short-subunit alcohol dehydrogenase family)
MTQMHATGGPGGPLVLVTGSTRGIGFGIATHLMGTGSRVVVHGRDRDRVEQAQDQARAARPGTTGTTGTVVGGVVADLSRPDQVAALEAEVEARWGVPDGLVLNAGGSVIPPGPVEEIAPEDWDRAVQDNLTSAFLTLRAFLPGMKRRGSGAIVAVSSAVTRRSSARSPVAYTAAKAGLEALVRCVAQQAGPAGVRANCVVPETIMTERNERMIPVEIREQLVATHPVRRLGTVDDVAAAVAFLLSPAAAWTTGEAIGVTGGA